MTQAGKTISAELLVRLLRTIIYSGQPGSKKFILSNFPDIIEQAQEFEKNCAAITAIIYTTSDEPVVEIKGNNLTLFNIDALFQKEFRLKTMSAWDSNNFNEMLGNKVDYMVVQGRSMSGKSTVSNMMAKHFNQKIIDMKKIEEEVKAKLSTEDEPLEEVPI